MAQPVWITPAGSLGTIPEGVFYQVALLAEEPVLGSPLQFQVIAGTLPDGIQCDATGLIAGVPKAVASVQGVPTEVAADVTSKFTVRVYTTRVINGRTVIDRLADRTFTMTVTGPDAPEFTTPPGTITNCYDGTVFNNFQIGYTDTDPGDVVTVTLVSGSLPPGVTLSRSGLLSGFVGVNAEVEVTAGFSRDGQGYDEYPFDFSTRSSDTTYEFTLRVSDGTNSNLRTFNIVVYSQNNLTADNENITADNTFVTADQTNVRLPIIVTPQGSIGSTNSDNFYAFRFQGLDLDGSPIQYEMTGSIPGLMLDPNTGWLYGYIPVQNINNLTYDFSLRVFKSEDPSYISNPYYYSLTLLGPLSNDITWVTPSDLGTIVNGATSTLRVEAVSRAGLSLQYRLLSGSNSNLPQGLQLLPSGNIAGRCSFDTFALDGGTTVFDVDSRNRLPGPTTFDMTHTFTVQVFSVNGVVNTTKTFTITVVREYNEPYQNLYVQAMPPANDRAVLNRLLQDPQIFPPDLIYRNDDPNFGVAKRVIYRHAFGLTAATLEDYYSSLYLNHYWKNLVLGQIEVARATDSNGNTLYEVVYSRVIDNLLNSAGESVSKQVTLPFPIVNEDSTETDTVYPNSLINMRDQVIDTVGQVGNILPTWMISKQTTGRVLGFVPAWVLCYAKPGQGERIAYNIRTQYGEQLNLVDFKVDRYELDNLLTYNWDPVTKSWQPPASETTFDLQNHYELPEPNDSSLVFVGGTGYAVNDRILVLGSQVGGVNGTNDVTIVVEQVDENGTIEQARASGFAPLFSTGNLYTNVAGTNITGTGIGATWDILVTGADATTFDQGSLKFIAPVNMYSDTQAYDRYLLFPYSTITGPLGTSPPAGWINNGNSLVGWINNASALVPWINSEP